MWDDWIKKSAVLQPIQGSFRHYGWAYTKLPLNRLMAKRTGQELDLAAGRKVWMNTFRARADKVIAAGRILLAIGSLCIAWLDSTHRPTPPETIYFLLIAYFAYALMAAIFVWQTEISRVRGTLIRHVVDVIVFTVLMFMTQGTSSPFFMLMPFTLLSATLHWRWRGAFWTSLICVAVLLYLGAFDTTALLDPDDGTTANVSRVLFICVAAILLIWLGVHQEAVRAEMLRLVQRTPALPEGRDWPAGVALDYAVHVMGARRAILVWSDADEPWTYLATWENGVCDVAHMAPDLYSPPVAEGLLSKSLLISDAQRARLLVHKGEGRFEQWRGEEAPLCEALVTEFAVTSAVSVPFRVGDLEARLFLLEPPTLALEDVAIAEIIADRIKVLFEQAVLVRKLSDAAAGEERVKIGRDLHDGVLQSLAGTALQLQTLRSLGVDGDEALGRRLTAIQNMLTDEQRELRAFIRALEPGHKHGGVRVPELAGQFEALAARLQQQWAVDICFTVGPADLRLPATMAYQLSRMTSEATANAVRHGAATKLDIDLRLSAGRLLLTVADNGIGFGFERRVEHEELQRNALGPRSLQQRAMACGGKLSIERVAEWTRIVVMLPMHP
ncbi:sensor histidine kinase [Sinorhizobium numidicum]|uniref:Sensor histidine kinase n=1 Tax=Sinorhizobium numidicum TaxID=680248 RepID=A0ABY8CTW4_9HYPH|nr:sensor histidine kinase [Sinorhizobium numidicum]WEX75595.1 sensor histidine kinase [Sinorhizobium numidicum]WEX81592.1 sensor histidine kinase [Sinorhizobium numidicum]